MIRIPPSPALPRTSRDASDAAQGVAGTPPVSRPFLRSLKTLRARVASLSLLALIPATSCGPSPDPDSPDRARVIRFGHFPNLTHIQALVARNMARHGQGWFERFLPGYSFEWYTFKAGPAAMEALLGKTVDVTYTGLNPAINAFCVSSGHDIRLLAGAVRGGSALLVQPGSGLSRPLDFRDKAVATPQLGNTQDVTARAWFAHAGFPVPLGAPGHCRIIPTPNASQLAMFQQRQVDAVWTVEPWVSWIERDAHGQILVNDSNSITTVLAARTDWIQRDSALARRLRDAHASLSLWIQQHPDEARQRVREELSLLTQSDIPADIIDSAWQRLRADVSLNHEEVSSFASDALAAGILDGDIPDLDGLFPDLDKP